ncbi:MAG TPA: GAF domain-containing protein [Geminicoccaceae bacterium]
MKDSSRHQQADLAAFGRRATEGEDLDQLLSEAAREVAESLDIGFVKILEYQPEQGNLLLRAGVGWDPSELGRATVGAELRSPAGYALHTGRPVIANDLEREERFEVPQLLRDHGVRSAVNVIIRDRADVYGVLEADSRETRVFTDDDAKFLQGYANILSFVIAQNRLVKENARYARLQKTYFDELQHRIKNNNQQLLSLINLQLAGVVSPEAREHLEKVAARILALSRVNDQLQSGTSPDRVDLGEYLLAVLTSLFEVQPEAARRVQLETETSAVEIGTRDAQTIGLIVNEFLTNSFKHGFGDRGVFRLELTSDGRTVTLVMADDGAGLPKGVTPGLGMKLIEALSRQLRAEATWSNRRVGGAGTTLQLRFPLLDPGGAPDDASA